MFRARDRLAPLGLATALSLGFLACASEHPLHDAGFDGGPDGGVDAGPDAGVDAGADGGLPGDYAAADFDTGQAVSLTAFRGKTVLLTSWTQHCASCADDLVGLEALWLAHQHQTVAVIAVNLDATADHASAAAERQSLGLTLPVWSDPGNAFATVFGATAVPATALIDAQGNVIQVFQGPVAPDDPTLLALLGNHGVPLQSGTPCGAAEAGGTSCILVIIGRVTDPQGSPLTGASLTYCGLTTCYYGLLDDAGGFRVELGVVLNPDQYALIVHGGLLAAGIYERLPTPTSAVVTLGAPIVTPLFPDSGPLLPLQSATAAEIASAGVALQIPADTHFTIPIEDAVSGDGGSEFVVTSVAPSAAPAFAPAALGLFALYALGPFGASSSGLVGVTVPNSIGLLPGTATEFLVLDDDLDTAPFAAGTLRVAARGAVSADGGFISTPADGGIDVLTWLGVRLAGD